jgi:two-component system, sensor histidine kinase LadS
LLTQIFCIFKFLTLLFLGILSTIHLKAQIPLVIDVDNLTRSQSIDYVILPDTFKTPEGAQYIQLKFIIRNQQKKASSAYFLFVNQEQSKKLYNATTRQLLSQSGLYAPIRAMPVPFQPFYLNIALTNEYEQVFYLNISKSNSYKKIQLNLVAKQLVESQNIQYLREDYFLMGILLVMVFYNLILFSLMLDRSYLYYVIYISTLGIWIFYEYLYYYSDFSLAFVISIINTWWVIFFNIGYLGFVRHFLNAKSDFPTWNKWIKFLEKLLLLPLSLILYDFFNFIYYPATETYFEVDAIIMALLSLVNVVVCLIFGLYAWWHHSRLARFFLLANAPLLASGVYFGLEYLIIQPFLVRDLHSYLLLRQMVILEIVLLAIALAYRYNILKKEIAQKEAEALRQIERTAHLKTQTENLESLNQAKDKLFSIIGHDLRSPINSLQGALYLLNNQTISQQQFLDISQKLQKNVESLQFTFDNLFHWAYTQMGGIQTEITEINLSQIVQQNIEFLQGNANYKNIQLNNELPQSLWAKGDADQISLVVRNLINNAIKFTSVGGQVTLKSQQNLDSVDISVIDTGAGIAPEKLAQIFNRNIITTTRGTAGEKGTGLGLLLCKEMIENNGGMIWVNTELNKGSTFTFRLPSLGK